MSEAPDSATHVLDKGFEGVFADIGQTGSFDPPPEALHGIELWRVGRESNDLQSRLTLEELSHRLRAVRLQTVPDQDDPSSKVAQEVADEDQDLWSAHFASVKAQQHSTTTIATIGQRSDRRHAFPAAHLRPQHRRLAPRSPGATDD